MEFGGQFCQDCLGDPMVERTVALVPLLQDCLGVQEVAASHCFLT